MADQLEKLKAALADRYRIERELGAGGMATVYLAEDLQHSHILPLVVENRLEGLKAELPGNAGD